MKRPDLRARLRAGNSSHVNLIMSKWRKSAAGKWKEGPIWCSVSSVCKQRLMSTNLHKNSHYIESYSLTVELFLIFQKNLLDLFQGSRWIPAARILKVTQGLVCKRVWGGLSVHWTLGNINASLGRVKSFELLNWGVAWLMNSTTELNESAHEALMCFLSWSCSALMEVH